MDEQSGLICAAVLDGAGGAAMLDWDGVQAWTPADGVLWLHLDYAAEDSQAWLEGDSGLDRIIRDALLARDPRPRSVTSGDGLMLIIRGVNLNEGSQPEDMVSCRAWLDEHRVVTLRHRRINALKAIKRDLEGGHGPTTTADFLVDLVEKIMDRIGRVTDQLDDSVAAMEDAVVGALSLDLRHRLADLRRQAIALRRYIAPERDVVNGLRSEPVDWLGDVERQQLRESADRLTRIIEDLDAARDRAAVTHEEVVSRLSELINQRLYTLSIIAAVFLPLGFITGMMGVNVGGVPGEGSDWGFAILCAAMAVLGGVQLWLFRKLRWL